MVQIYEMRSIEFSKSVAGRSTSKGLGRKEVKNFPLKVSSTPIIKLANDDSNQCDQIKIAKCL